MINLIFDIDPLLKNRSRAPGLGVRLFCFSFCFLSYVYVVRCQSCVACLSVMQGLCLQYRSVLFMWCVCVRTFRVIIFV